MILRAGWVRVTVVLLSVLLLTVTPVSGGLAPGSQPGAPDRAFAEIGASNATTTDTFRVDYRVTLSEDPENVTVRLTLYDHPALGSFRVRLPDGATVTDTRGFERVGEEEWGWSESPSEPTLTYEVPVGTEGDTRLRGADWAILAGVDDGVSWTEFEDLEVRRTYSTAGGYGGDRAVAIGNVTVRSLEGPSGDTTVVAPRAIAEGVAFEEVNATVVDLEEWMPVSGANPRTNVFVVPSGRDFGAAGTAVGGGDFLVDERYVAPGSSKGVFAHEYTHTRQSFDTGTGMAWFTEGSAEYYEERYLFERRIDSFDWYRSAVSVEGRGVADATLSESGDTSRAAYEKGSHVLVALDVLLRSRTDGEARVDDVFDRMNAHDGPVDYDDFRSMVAAEAGTSLDGWLDLHVRGRSLPALPTNASLVAPTRWRSADAPDDLYVCVDGEWRTSPSLLPAGEPVAVFDKTHAVVDVSGAERVGEGTGSCSLDALPVYSPRFGEPTDKFGRSTATTYVFENDTTVTFRSAFDPSDVTTLEVAVVEQSTPTATATPEATPTVTSGTDTDGAGGDTATPASTGENGATETVGETTATAAAAEPDVPPLVVEPRSSGLLVRRGSVSALFPLPILAGMAGFLSCIAGATYLLLRE